MSNSQIHSAKLKETEESLKKDIRELKAISTGFYWLIIVSVATFIFFLLTEINIDDPPKFESNRDLIYNLLPKLSIFVILQIFLYNFFRSIRNNRSIIDSRLRDLHTIVLISEASEAFDQDKEQYGQGLIEIAKQKSTMLTESHKEVIETPRPPYRAPLNFNV